VTAKIENELLKKRAVSVTCCDEVIPCLLSQPPIPGGADQRIHAPRISKYITDELAVMFHRAVSLGIGKL